MIRNLKQILLFIAAILLCCCSSDKEVIEEVPNTKNNLGNVLAVYFSYTGNCREIVNTLTGQIKSDVLEIQPAEKGLKYEANNYALGTQLLNTIKDNPNNVSNYRPYNDITQQLPEYHHRHSTMVESNGCHHADVPVSERI